MCRNVKRACWVCDQCVVGGGGRATALRPGGWGHDCEMSAGPGGKAGRCGHRTEKEHVFLGDLLTFRENGLV